MSILFLFFVQMGPTVCYPPDNHVQVTALTIAQLH